MIITCPHCTKLIEINPAQLLRGIQSKARSEAARLNGRKGGRPKKEKVSS